MVPYENDYLKTKRYYLWKELGTYVKDIGTRTSSVGEKRSKLFLFKEVDSTVFAWYY